MVKRSTKVGVSILSGDFSRLGDEAKRIEDAGADAVHIDIMDGHFVPNLTMGPKAVEAINRSTDLFLDVHLMMYNPFDYIERFIEVGADLITFHFEATENIEETIQFIHRCGKKAGLAFNPETSVSLSLKYFDLCDLVLFMSVHPGFGGQQFIPDVLEKIEIAKGCYLKSGGQESRKSKDPLMIQVDGGINPDTAKQVIDAGANFVVSGHYLFSLPVMQEGVQTLRNS
ncbi:MAG: ribulose-phosphate 3-epimerase [Parachlamydiales bacterium]|nr:ribulose-phosphate 3-epimerase [Parachlamydiales bacterium]